jgi:guanosine-3',5'-bis(diphosphate) 3'-pyrophosphohydrolase
VNGSEQAACAAAFGALCAQVMDHHPDADVAHLARVYGIAERSHREQRRASGEPYILHPLAVAGYVAQWGMPLACVDAALLHDVPEAGGDLRQFPDDVSVGVIDLVQAVSVLPNDEDPALAMAGADPEFIEHVLTLKIADRLHNARTWKFIPGAKRRLRAHQTIELVVPAASLLGLTAVSLELQHLATGVLADGEPVGRESAPVVGLSGFTLRQALRLLPPEDAERYAAEWSADLVTIETVRGRVAFSIGLIYSALALRRRGNRSGR